MSGNPAPAPENDLTANDERMISVLSSALREVFGENTDAGRFIDVSRIPLICKQIGEIHGKLEEVTGMLKELALVRKIVFGAVGLILIGFFSVLLSFAFGNK